MMGELLWPTQFTTALLTTFDLFRFSLPISPGHQVIEEQRRRLAELKQRAVAEAQCQWEALHGSQTQLLTPPSSSSQSSTSALATPLPLVHHSILHHQPVASGEQPYDTLSLESSDSVDTSVSTGNNSVCSPDNMSRYMFFFTVVHVY